MTAPPPADAARVDGALDAFYAVFGGEVVFLDLETTGCEAGEDRIVEIGALKFRGREETGRFETFVNPGVEFPPRIAHLTGIDPAALRGAPPFAAVRDDFLAFLGEAPVFAHNAEQDRAFLVSALGGGLANPFHDTCFFACLVFPDLVRYSLDSLVELFGLAPRGHHTALNDARLTREMFDRLACAAARTMPVDLAARLAAATLPAETSLRLFVAAVAEARARLGDAPCPAGPPSPPACDFNVELSIRVRDAVRAGRPTLVNAPRGARRPAALLSGLAASGRRALLLVSGDDDLARWRAAAAAVAPAALVLERFFDYLCPRLLLSALDGAAAAGTLDGFGVYLRLLLERRAVVCRADLSPYVVHRSAEGNRLVERACGYRLDCAADCPDVATCDVKRLEDEVAAAPLLVTPLANVYALHRLGRLALLADRAVAVDAPERFDSHFEPALDSVSFLACREEVGRLEAAFAPAAGDEGALAPLARAASKYLERLLGFLREETAGSAYPVALRRDMPKYEEFLCHILDFHIHAANLARLAAAPGAPALCPGCREALVRLSRWNGVLADFFQGEGRYLRSVRAEGDDLRLELMPVEGAAPLGSLLRGRGGAVVAVTGALADDRVRDHVLEASGLAAAGNYEMVDLASGGGPALVVPREMPESSPRNQALFDERFRDLVLRVAREAPGRLVVVFNSTARLKALGPELGAALEAIPGLLVLRQYRDGGKEKMHRAARGLVRVAMLGSAGFYQVLDGEEGEADVVIVEKAPFPHVQNELVALRRSRLKARGYDDFADYMVPAMLLKMAAVARRVAPGGALVVADGRLPAMDYFPSLREAVAPSRVHDSIDAFLRRKAPPA